MREIPGEHRSNGDRRSDWQGPATLRLRTALPSLSEGYAKVARWLLEASDDELRRGSTQSIGRATGLSKATVVRLPQLLGYDGFTDLQLALLVERLTQAREQSPGPGWRPAFVKTYEKSVQSFETTRMVLGQQAFDRASELIAESQRIFWFGIGDSGHYANSGDHKAVICGFNTRVFTDGNQMRSVVNTCETGDVIVAISQSGAFPVHADWLTTARMNGAAVIAVTSDPQSRLVRHADVVLLSGAPNVYVRGEVVSLRSVHSFLIEALILAAVERRDPEAIDWGS